MKCFFTIRISALLLAVAAFSACQSDSKPETAEAPPTEKSAEQPAAGELAAAPGAAADGTVAIEIQQRNAALVKLLQGKWQSESDADYIIEFDGNKMRHLNGGKLSEETEFKTDATCASQICLVNGSAPVGWCLLENSKSGVQCNLAIRFDQHTLVYRMVGAAGGDLAFKKM